MFHRTMNENSGQKAGQNSGKVQKAKTQNDQKNIFRKRVESSAVSRYAKYQQEQGSTQQFANEQANQNVDGPVEIVDNTQNYNMNNNQKNYTQNQTTQNQIEEDNFMNNPEQQKPEEKAIAPQNRDVNIPGNNFKRPAQAAAQPAGRPGYAGGAAYNAASPANGPYGATASQSNGRKLVIGQGITMSGEIEACEHLIVEGTIEATLKGANVLDVYESGAFLGTVEIDEANIAGRFEGDITVKGRLTIESTGEVIGSISYKELSMEAGAVIDGAVSPIGSTNKPKKAAPASKGKKASASNGAELPFADKAAE